MSATLEMDNLTGRLLHHASLSMEADDYYKTHTREESAVEIRRRVAELRKDISACEPTFIRC